MREAIACFSTRSTSTVTISYDVAVRHEFEATSIRKARDGASRRHDLSRFLIVLSRSCRDQQTKNPDRTLVRIGSLRRFVHGTFCVPADGGKLLAQISIGNSSFSSRSHIGKEWLQHSRRSPHQIE